jgi:hypothetical protein
MGHLRWMTLLGFLSAGCLLFAGRAATQDKETTEKKTELGKGGHGGHGGHFRECAKACSACLQECESCALHCSKLVADGKKNHRYTLGACLDCGQICAAAAAVVSRHGPLSEVICDGCAKACDKCGAACEKFRDDEHMQRCAKACRDCAQACRDMIKMIAPKPSSR